eukprot:1229850-Amphidinium_carterae.1
MEDAELKVCEAMRLMARYPEENAEQLMKITEKELRNGWIRGPYTKHQVDEIHGPGGWVAAR